MKSFEDEAKDRIESLAGEARRNATQAGLSLSKLLNFGKLSQEQFEIALKAFEEIRQLEGKMDMIAIYWNNLNQKGQDDVVFQHNN